MVRRLRLLEVLKSAVEAVKASKRRASDNASSRSNHPEVNRCRMLGIGVRLEVVSSPGDRDLEPLACMGRFFSSRGQLRILTCAATEMLQCNLIYDSSRLIRELLLLSSWASLQIIDSWQMQRYRQVCASLCSCSGGMLARLTPVRSKTGASRKPYHSLCSYLPADRTSEKKTGHNCT